MERTKLLVSSSNRHTKFQRQSTDDNDNGCFTNANSLRLSKWRHDTQHIDTQHNDTQHEVLICTTQHKQHSA